MFKHAQTLPVISREKSLAGWGWQIKFHVEEEKVFKMIIQCALHHQEPFWER